MISACPSCKSYYKDSDLTLCPCNGELFRLSDEREAGLIAAGYEKRRAISLTPKDNNSSFLEHLLSSPEVRLVMRGPEEGTLPSIRALEVGTTTLWLGAENGSAAIYAATVKA